MSSNGLAQKKKKRKKGEKILEILFGAGRDIPALHSVFAFHRPPPAESRYRALSISRLIDSRISITPPLKYDVIKSKMKLRHYVLYITLEYSTELSSKRHRHSFIHFFFLTKTDKMCIAGIHLYTCVRVWEFVKTNSNNARHQLPFPNKMCTWRQKVPNHILCSLTLKGKNNKLPYLTAFLWFSSFWKFKYSYLIFQ